MSSPYVGEIRMFGGNFAPNGWMLCQGQTLPIAENEVLFQLIGTTYGGDGQETFNLPNLQSRVPVHVGPGFVQAQQGGEETVTLTVQQIPSHSHVPQGDGTNNSSNSPSGTVWAGTTTLKQFSSVAPNVSMAPQALGNDGGSQPHDNMIPFLAINFIISLFGVFPTQN